MLTDDQLNRFHNINMRMMKELSALANTIESDCDVCFLMATIVLNMALIGIDGPPAKGEEKEYIEKIGNALEHIGGHLGALFGKIKEDFNSVKIYNVDPENIPDGHTVN